MTKRLVTQPFADLAAVVSECLGPAWRRAWVESRAIVRSGRCCAGRNRIASWTR